MIQSHTECSLPNYTTQGYGGRCLKFIKALYSHSHITVRVGAGRLAQLSESFPLLRGVRQGCPLSPVLFNIFINDIFGEETTGVTVPVSNGEPPYINGILFADDAAGLSADLRTAGLFCDGVTQWTRENKMEVGISKCGILEILPKGEDSLVDTLQEGDALLEGLQIQGEPVPIVQEYKYLGLVLNQQLEVATMVKKRLQLGKITVQGLLPYLRCNTIVMSMRLRVIQAVVCQCLLYGAKVYGMNRQLTKKDAGPAHKMS
jgi:Reverse transcriptase (RNA-dependent DNA polymerase)